MWLGGSFMNRFKNIVPAVLVFSGGFTLARASELNVENLPRCISMQPRAPKGTVCVTGTGVTWIRVEQPTPGWQMWVKGGKIWSDVVRTGLTLLEAQWQESADLVLSLPTDNDFKLLRAAFQLDDMGWCRGEGQKEMEALFPRKPRETWATHFFLHQPAPGPKQVAAQVYLKMFAEFSERVFWFRDDSAAWFVASPDAGPEDAI